MKPRTDPTEWTAERIRELRKRLGLTQAQAAAAVGVSRPAWTGYESGQGPPSLPVRILLGMLDAGKLPLATVKS